MFDKRQQHHDVVDGGRVGPLLRFGAYDVMFGC